MTTSPATIACPPSRAAATSTSASPVAMPTRKRMPAGRRAVGREPGQHPLQLQPGADAAHARRSRWPPARRTAPSPRRRCTSRPRRRTARRPGARRRRSRSASPRTCSGSARSAYGVKSIRSTNSTLTRRRSSLVAGALGAAGVAIAGCAAAGAERGVGGDAAGRSCAQGGSELGTAAAAEPVVVGGRSGRTAAQAAAMAILLATSVGQRASSIVALAPLSGTGLLSSGQSSRPRTVGPRQIRFTRRATDQVHVRGGTTDGRCRARAGDVDRRRRRRPTRAGDEVGATLDAAELSADRSDGRMGTVATPRTRGAGSTGPTCRRTPSRTGPEPTRRTPTDGSTQPGGRAGGLASVSGRACRPGGAGPARRSPRSAGPRCAASRGWRTSRSPG